MFDVITFGSATKDTFLQTKEGIVKDCQDFVAGKGVCFPLGSKVKAEEIYFTSGGGGTNTATTFAKRGFHVAYCGKIGKDSAGDQVIRDLDYYKIDKQFLSFTSERPTSHSIVVDVPKKDRTIFTYRGASALLSMEDVPLSAMKAKWFYLAPFSSLTENLFYEILDYAKEKGIKVMVNPGKNQLKDSRIKDALSGVEILLLNMEEASILTGVPYEKKEEVLRKVSSLAKEVVLVTQGEEEAVAYSKEVFYRATPQKVETVDRTGAGDSFGASFLGSYMEEGDVKKGLQLALANSVACLQKKGAKHGLLGREDHYQRAEIRKSDLNSLEEL